jgi:ankyrin repeat protein
MYIHACVHVHIHTFAPGQGWNKEMALGLAAKNGRHFAVRYLLKQGAAKNTFEIGGRGKNHPRTPLGHGCSHGRLLVVRELLQAGADINVAADSGETPAYTASQWGNTEMLTLLLENGADVNLADMRGKTALMVAAIGGHFAEAKLLVGAGADQTKRDKLGKVHSSNHLLSLTIYI